ncbi:MAG TPA: hypothetical protein VIL20_05910, partial [Sandaracinaceae bacterium]
MPAMLERFPEPASPLEPGSADATAGIPSALAMPKSHSFTSPSKEISTFDGETSRCTMPRGRPSSSVARCAKSSAASTSRTTKSANSAGSAMRRRLSARSSWSRSKPSTYSIAMK